MKILYTTLLILSFSKIFGQQYSIITREDIKKKYESAFLEIKAMLDKSTTPSFKRAVFVTENAFINDSLTYEQFDKGIQFLASRCRLIEKQSNLAYAEKDKAEVLKNFAVFKLMSDTVKYYIDSTKYIKTFPFTYDFNDFWGELNWQQMFVTKLLRTGKGNCHSLPFLYKILL